MKYLPRKIEKTLRRFLQVFPVVGLTGPRQSGKSTLLKRLFPEYEYVTFDDLQKVVFFEEDPKGFLKRYAKKVIFDEVQLVPEIFHHIKLLVDQNRGRYGNFILTGSSQFSFLQSAAESLAGRIGLLSLLPFQFSEVPKALRKESVFRGSYPELITRSYKESGIWYSSYIETYLNKDLRTLANVGDMRDFRRLIYLLASQVSQTVDFSSYARDLGVSMPTVKRWISILEASYVVFLLPPYFRNYGKRLVKSPKLFFYDTGLVSYLTGMETYSQYDRGPLAGALFENYIISEIYKKELHRASDAKLYFLRTQDQLEVDLIIDRKSTKEWIEIKKSSTVKPSMLQNLKKLVPEKETALLLYQGEKERFQEISILPYTSYLI